MKKYFDILRKCRLFNQMDDESLEKLLGCLGAKVVFFDKKYTIFTEGVAAKHIGIVLSGTAHIIQYDYLGNRSILAEIKPSEVFGEAFACAGISSLPVSVVADEPCEIMILDCYRVLHLCDKHCRFHQELIFNLMQDMATKTIMFHQKIEIISKRTTRERLMTYLMLQSKKTGKASFTVPFDRQELADYLEVDRSGLSAEISKLRRDGIIKSDKNKFTIIQ